MDFDKICLVEEFFRGMCVPHCATAVYNGKGRGTDNPDPETWSGTESHKGLNEPDVVTCWVKNGNSILCKQVKKS